jgi:hypothetical protein
MVSGQMAGRTPAPPPLQPIDVMVYTFTALVIVIMSGAGGFGIGFWVSYLLHR